MVTIVKCVLCRRCIVITFDGMLQASSIMLILLVANNLKQSFCMGMDKLTCNIFGQLLGIVRLLLKLCRCFDVVDVLLDLGAH